MRRTLLALLAFLALPIGCLAAPVMTLRYAHPNEAESVAGLQASYFASRVDEYTRGAIAIELYPASQMGSLGDQVDLVRRGVIDIHHATAAAIGSLYPDFAVLDTPYLYRDVCHLLRVVDPASPVMRKLSAGLLKSSGVQVLYTFYFGTRQLSCDRAVYGPKDLAGVAVRSIPFPLYSLAVEALGATPIPVDWSDTAVALATKAVSGQENPVNIILSAKLYDYQSHLMLTSHIRSAGIVVINAASWQRVPAVYRPAIERAAREASSYATRLCLDGEEKDLAALESRGMKVIGPADGLDVAAFAARARRLVAERYGSIWAEYYRLIASLE
jgi:tripartite ATP-independent transporter DctP family solute receptor